MPERWSLDPLTSVGPLRFGMSPDQVKDALNGARCGVSRGRPGDERWQLYDDPRVTAIYAPGPRLVAVAIDRSGGPPVRFRDVELIGRPPSEVRSAVHDLATRDGVAAGVNWSGDPEVAAWGISLDPRQVAAALGGEEPAERRGSYPYACRGEDAQWYLAADRFDQAGLTAHYRSDAGVPTLGAVTVHGRTGPQLHHEGLPLIGGSVAAVDAELVRRAREVEYAPSGDLGFPALNITVRAARAGDHVVSEVRFCSEGWQDN